MLNALKDKMAKDLYGISRTEALQKGICVSCKEPAMPKCTTTAGRKEYPISGLCEVCYDKIFENID